MTLAKPAVAGANDRDATPGFRGREGGSLVTTAARRHSWALGGYLALTTLFHWSAVRDVATRVVFDGGDGASFLWSYWYIPRAIGRLDNPFYTGMLFHPVGAHLAFHTNTPLEAVIIWPFSRLFGLAFGVNVVMLGAVVLSALGAYLLALRVCGSRRAAFVAGAAFAFLPAQQPRIFGHHNLTHTWVLPLGLLALLRLYERPTRARGIAFGAMVGVSFLTDLSLTLFLLLAVVVIAAWRWRHTCSRPMAVRLAQAAAVATVLGFPLLVAMATSLRSGELDSPQGGWGGASIHSSDVLSWVLPSAGHRWWGQQVAPLTERFGGGEHLAYPGLLILVLGVLGATVAVRSRRTEWIALFATFFILSLGPFLKVNGVVGDRFELLGERFSVPLPYIPIRFLPVLNALRIPSRFAIMGALSLAVLAAIALADLQRRHRRLAWVLPALVLVVTVVEFLPKPYRLAQDRIPRPYASIASSDAGGAVLELPLQWRDGFGPIGDNLANRDDTLFLYYATRHERPLVNGMAARYPDKRRVRLLSIPVYRQVLALQGDPAFAQDVAIFTAADLRALGISFVVYHRDRPMTAAFDYFSRMNLIVLDDDGTVLVWRVP